MLSTDVLLDESDLSELEDDAYEGAARKSGSGEAANETEAGDAAGAKHTAHDSIASLRSIDNSPMLATDVLLDESDLSELEDDAYEGAASEDRSGDSAVVSAREGGSGDGAATHEEEARPSSSMTDRSTDKSTDKSTDSIASMSSMTGDGVTGSMTGDGVTGGMNKDIVNSASSPSSEEEERVEDFEEDMERVEDLEEDMERVEEMESSGTESSMESSTDKAGRLYEDMLGQLKERHQGQGGEEQGQGGAEQGLVGKDQGLRESAETSGGAGRSGGDGLEVVEAFGSDDDGVEGLKELGDDDDDGGVEGLRELGDDPHANTAIDAIDAHTTTGATTGTGTDVLAHSSPMLATDVLLDESDLSELEDDAYEGAASEGRSGDGAVVSARKGGSGDGAATQAGAWASSMTDKSTDSITSSEDEDGAGNSARAGKAAHAARMAALGFGDDGDDVLSELDDDDDDEGSASSASNAKANNTIGGVIAAATANSSSDEDDDYGYSASGDFGNNFLVGNKSKAGGGAGAGGAGGSMARLAGAGLVRGGAAAGGRAKKPWDSTGGLTSSAFSLGSMRSQDDGTGTGSSSDEFDEFE
jgi:hypothetical protein